MSNAITPIHAVLFDLDGTLLDTAPDLISALNNLLEHYDRASVDFEKLRNLASQGSVALTRYGFPEVTDDIQFEKLRQEFLQHYAQCVCVDSKLFNGMKELLETIEENDIPWGIVTNKPGDLTKSLLNKLSLPHQPACIVCGDTLKVRKPHPDPLLLASKTIQLSPHHTIYLGDDPRDIYAGNAAGMYTCVARYGYIEPDIDTDQWGADFTINNPLELLTHIQLSTPINEMGT
ncbi:MAG: HAD-IA family hydrolase [Gammaproteobacteria bacterium]|nr:HAD-IA family hydrolase [Gammaproteobacteria bacterium]